MNKSSDNSNKSLAENNGLNNIERKPISYLTIKDNGKNINIPIYHAPGTCGCACINCKLAKGVISLDFYKGFCLGVYLQEGKEDRLVKLLFNEDELAEYSMNF